MSDRRGAPVAVEKSCGAGKIFYIGTYCRGVELYEWISEGEGLHTCYAFSSSHDVEVVPVVDPETCDLYLCPTVILYTLGFVIELKPRSGLIRTSLVYLSSFPINAAIYLEGVLYSKKTPTAIPGLPPGQYRVNLALEGYRPRETHVLVRSRRATVISPVILIP